MRRLPMVLLAVLMLVLVLGPSAGAQSVTVDGSGDIKKMYVNNAQKVLTVKVFGMGKPCDAAHLRVNVRWGEKDQYIAEGTCIEAKWYKGLYYQPDRGNDNSIREVDCDGFKFTYDKDGKFYKIVMPRSCLGKANNKVKVDSFGNDFGSTTGGEAGPTKLLDRG